jgi:hypothetical protein
MKTGGSLGFHFSVKFVGTDRPENVHQKLPSW